MPGYSRREVFGPLAAEAHGPDKKQGGFFPHCFHWQTSNKTTSSFRSPSDRNSKQLGISDILTCQKQLADSDHESENAS